MIGNQFILPIAAKLIVDLFAGGGGASTGIEQAIGRHVDIAINHDPDAIGTLRMLVPRELYNAQDFPPTYIIDRTSTGKLLTKTAQVRMCGNSVSPLPMRRLVEANYVEHQARRAAA